MKRIFTLFLISISLMGWSQTEVEVTMGAGYANDAFYSFENGTVATSPRINWDIAFATNRFNVSILANNGGEVELYTYPNGDISAWESVDISGIGSWPMMYNSVESWDEGAFNRNVDPNNPFDFGWGIYNPSTHHIVGDSLYVIKTVSGNYKKLWIVEKDPTNGINTWEFKYANIDGSEEQTLIIEGDDHIDKNFVHYSLEGNQIMEKEPDSDEFELQFTRYYDYTIPYYVVGIYSNSPRVTVEEVSGVDQTSFEDFTEANFSTNITTIGSDWKYFDLDQMVYLVETDRVYFCKVLSNNGADSTYWKFYFTNFTGMSEGTSTFIQKKLQTTVGVDQIESTIFAEVYPNPANEFVNLVLDTKEDAFITILNSSGQEIFSKNYSNNHLQSKRIDTRSWAKGYYIVRINTPTSNKQIKFIKI